MPHSKYTSSLKEWERAAARANIKAETKTICCYPLNQGWIEAQAKLICDALEGGEFLDFSKVRVLFSAHGLPKKVIKSGDPYQWQIEKTAAAVIEKMKENDEFPTINDWQVCYQSRVGPLEWIGPATESELARAAKEKIAVVVVPIAFVSEHSETLVELDIEYREEAEKLGVPNYVRVPAVSIHPSFVDGLKSLVDGVLDSHQSVTCGLGRGKRFCPNVHKKCPIELRE